MSEGTTELRPRESQPGLAARLTSAMVTTYCDTIDEGDQGVGDELGCFRLRVVPRPIGPHRDTAVEPLGLPQGHDPRPHRRATTDVVEPPHDCGGSTDGRAQSPIVGRRLATCPGSPG